MMIIMLFATNFTSGNAKLVPDSISIKNVPKLEIALNAPLMNALAIRALSVDIAKYPVRQKDTQKNFVYTFVYVFSHSGYGYRPIRRGQ